MAMLASIYVNAHLKEGARQVEPADFIPGAKAEAQMQFPPGVIPISPDQFRRQMSANPMTRKA